MAREGNRQSLQCPKTRPKVCAPRICTVGDTSMAGASQKKKRRTQEEIFLDCLSLLTKDDQSLIPNATLKEKLGWDDDKYKEIKARLTKSKLVIVGQGHGGKIGLAKQLNEKALKLFVSYSHIDDDYKTELLKHLNPLKRLKLIESWSDQKILPGDKIDEKIKSELKTSDIILLLISIDYLNSYYCVEVEMEEAIERHKTGKSRVIPIIIRSCMWQNMPFAELKALPHDAKAVSKWQDRDDALVSVAEGIKIVAEEILESK